jgi:RNA polymerase sigma-70 factor (ECF subfamily)
MWPNSPETQELLDQVRGGQTQAVEQLLASHREPLRRMIGMRLDPALVGRVDASDVVQEVLLEASRRLRDYLRDPAMPFHLWLRHAELAAQLLDPEQTPATAAIRHELERRLHSAIAELEEDDREVILMRHFEQLSNQEVAAALGLSEAAASMRHLRAIRRLRILLAAG